MTLDQLRSFLAVARCESFTRAAEETHLTQPAVSAQIVMLEREYDARLFDRIGKRIEITEAGRVVLAAAEDILRRVEELNEEMRDLEGLKRGRLRLGASLIVGIYLLPEAIGLFKKTYPKLELTLRIEYARHIVEHVLAGDVDLGIIGEGNPICDERLVVEPFARDELVLIVDPRHSWAGRKSVSAGELGGESFIISEKGSATQQIIVSRLAEAGAALNVEMELGNIEAVKRAVEAGLGISIMSRCAIERDVEERRLVAIKLSDLPMARNLSFVRRRGQRASNAARAFMDFFAARFPIAEPKP
jgi:DNA-binding transcriptional LysR family regulator